MILLEQKSMNENIKLKLFDDFSEDLTEFFKTNSTINKLSAFELNKKNKVMGN